MLDENFSFKQLSDESFDLLKDAINEAKIVSINVYADRAIFVVQDEENTKYDWSVEPDPDGFTFYVVFNGEIVKFME